MADYNKTDLALNEDGDFFLDETGDLALATDWDCTKDDITMAVKTQKFDSEVWPLFGADLEELVGLPNTEKIAEEGVRRITAELVDKNLVNSYDLSVVPIPFGDEIRYYIMVRRRDGSQDVVEYPFNLSTMGG